MKKEVDKRLIIPKDAFEEEASEGLGRLNRDEAAGDLRDLEGRIADRLEASGERTAARLHDNDNRMALRFRRPMRIWIPAAAAVIILLIASTVYIGLFRDRQPARAETAMIEESKKDTVLIAMATPISKDEVEAKGEVNTEAKDEGVRYVPAVVSDAVSETAAVAEEVKAEIKAGSSDRIKGDMIIEILEPEELAEEVIVQAVPERSKAAQGIPATRTETRAEAKKATEAATRAAKDVAVADQQAEYKFAGPDNAPQPIGGIEVLNTWISSNIQYPAGALQRAVQQVVVSFKVRADSTVYDLKAEQSPGERFTEEAFRLLREGPKWIPAVRNGTFSTETVRVRISFKEQ